MHWVSPSAKDTATTLEKRLWDAADQFRANSGLKAQEHQIAQTTIFPASGKWWAEDNCTRTRHEQPRRIQFA